MTRKRRSSSFPQMGRAAVPVVASVNLNILDILDLKLNRGQHKCPHCGNFSSEETGRCSFCDEPVS
jgi:hypothetical protein